MDETKGYHSEISYENTAGLLSVNLYTKRVLYTGNTITMGSNLHNMNVSLVYNSLFELPYGDETGLGKKWKLDVEEYLYEYSDFYIYVDGLGSKHKFIKLKENKYYDESGLGYILDTSNGCVIKDIKGNELRFTNNHLTEVVTIDGVDIAYEYVGDLLVKMYSKNNDRNEIVFKYNKDNLLSSISKYRLGRLKERYKYYYYGGNVLRQVSKCTTLGEEELLFIEYKENEDVLESVFNIKSEESLRLETISENIWKLTKGYSNEKTIIKNENINYVGDEIYFDEDIYLGETASIVKKETESSYKVKNTEITFNDNNTQVEDEGKQYTYFFDTEGKTVSVFNTSDSNNYKTLNKYGGICFKLSNNNSNFKIDNYGTINNLNVDLSSSLQEEVDLKYDNYTAYLWIKKTSDDKNKIVVSLYNDKLFNDELIKKSTVNLNPKAINCWQPVMVPFTGLKDKKIERLTITFTNSTESIDISDVVIYPNNYSEIFIKNSNSYINVKDMDKVYYENNKYLNFSNITPTDLFYNCLEEYKQIKNNTSTRGFYVNNLSKCIESNNFTLASDLLGNINFSMNNTYSSSDTGEKHYQLPYFLKQKDSFNTKATITEYYIYINHDLYNTGNRCDYIVEKILSDLTDDSTCICKYYDMSGRIILTVDEYEVQTRYSYTNNSRNVVLRNKNIVSGEVLSSSVTWDDNSITKTEGELISNIKFDEVTNLVESIEEKYENENTTINKIEYSYGESPSKYDQIEIFNGSQKLGKNTIYYDNEDRVSYMTNNVNTRYNYNYEVFGETTTIYEYYSEDNSIERYHKSNSGNIYFERFNDNATTIHLDDDGKVINTSRNGFTSNEGMVFEYSKLYYYPDILIEGPNNKKEIYINNYETNNLSNSSGYKRKYDTIITSADNTQIIRTKELIVNKKEQQDKIKYISCLREGTVINLLDEGESYSVNTIRDTNVKVNPRALETNTFIGIGNDSVDYDNIGLKTSYEYDSIGRIVKKNIKTNISGDTTNDDVKVSKQTNYIPNTSLVGNEKYYINKVSEETPCINITYNINGTLDSYTILDKDNNQQTYTYLYDTKNQLFQEVNDGITKTYGYDNNGNITRKEVTNNDINNVYEYVYTNNRLTSINKDNELYCELAYDTIGNCTRYIKNNENNVLTWNYGNKLVQFTTNNSTSTNTTKYDYNIDGKRVQKVLNDGTYIDYYYEGNTLLWEYRTKEGLHTKISYIYDQEGISGFVIQDFINNNGPAIVVYKYIKDRLGNVIGITDGNNLLAKYKYDAWGNHKVYDGLGNENTDSNFIGNINPIRYRGYYYDVETGLFWLSSRYYSPELCRFISPDDVSYLDPQSVNGLNLYCYCGNDPINRVDPSGHSWKSFWNGIGNWFKNTFGAFVDLSYDIINTENSFDFIFGGFEAGQRVNKTIGDDSKPISIFATNASEWWKFWEYQVGIKFNIGKFSYSYTFGFGESNYSIGWENSTFDIQIGINKIGFGTSKTIDNQTIYSQGYIRTIPTLALVFVCIYAPGFIIKIIEGLIAAGGTLGPVL